MSSYRTSYPTPAPALFAPTIPATLASSNEAKPIYTSPPMQASSPSYTSSARVSKAMKGKRVHACERPGCHKVFTRAEHKRRHELSHEPKKQYSCSYEGCEKAFHRADYLTQHLSRHAPSKSKAKKSRADSESSSRSDSHQMPSQSTTSSAAPLALVESIDNHPRAWGSMDSSISCSQCSRAPSQSPASIDEHPSPYSYAGEPCSSPLPNDPFTPQYPSAGMPVEMVTVIDQYLRSILKPEAFSVPQQQIDPTIWSPDLEIDPTLLKMENQDQLPLYTWPPANDLSYETHNQMNQPQPDCQ